MPPEIQVNGTRLKERLLLNCLHLTATKHGCEILFVVVRYIGDAVITAYTTDSDIMCLANAASKIFLKWNNFRLSRWTIVGSAVVFATRDRVHALIFRQEWRRSVWECELIVAPLGTNDHVTPWRWI